MSDDLQLYELYFRKSKEYYIDKLTKYKSGQKFTFNVFAFLFGLFWFVYRKMYIQALLILLAIIGESFIEQLILANNVDENTSKTINIISTIAIATITGLLGNNLYIKQAEKSIALAKTKYKDNEQLEKAIKRKGGVSYILLILVVLTIIIFFVYNNYLTKNGS